MALSMLLYGIVWQRMTKRNAAKERERVAAFQQNGGLASVGNGQYADGGGRVTEKKEEHGQPVAA